MEATWSGLRRGVVECWISVVGQWNRAAQWSRGALKCVERHEVVERCGVKERQSGGKANGEKSELQSCGAAAGGGGALLRELL